MFFCIAEPKYFYTFVPINFITTQMEIKINLDLSNLKIRFEKALKIIDTIEHFEGKKRIYLASCDAHGMMFPNLRTKYLYQADICERASKRLTKKLLSKNF